MIIQCTQIGVSDGVLNTFAWSRCVLGFLGHLESLYMVVLSGSRKIGSRCVLSKHEERDRSIPSCLLIADPMARVFHQQDMMKNQIELDRS